ncbi:MAG: ArsB/NhaD family transporter [Thermodesulfobacteriota bacterium]
MDFWIATSVFVLVFAVIIWDKIDKTTTAMAGAALILLFRVLGPDEALWNETLGVDWGVIFLLISMMIIVNIMARTGVFQLLAVRSAKMARGEPFRVMLILAAVTAFTSAFLDNVTTVLLMGPVTLTVARQMDKDPVPFLITEALASNIGGTATLIGDPPNIMIGSHAGLTFMDFVKHLTPCIILVMAVWMIAWKLVLGRSMSATEEAKKRIMELPEHGIITDRPLLVRSLVVMGLTILGFLFHDVLGYEPAVVAFSGAVVLLLINNENPSRALSEVDWSTIWFFIGLFIVVGATVKVGLIELLSHKIVAATHPSSDNMLTLSMVILWFSGIASAVINNIPYVASMDPLIQDVTKNVCGVTACTPPAAVLPVWWSLALGACLGGNGTAIGASANVVAVDISTKAGFPISFGRFFRYGAPATLLTLATSAAYVYVRYYVLKF